MMSSQYNNSNNQNAYYQKEFKKLDQINYVKQAEQVIESIKYKRHISMTALRNLYALICELYDMARFNKSSQLSVDIQSHVQYVKMKITYHAGRDAEVRDFVNKSGIIKYLDAVGSSKNELLLVCHYAEALVAYHKYIINEKG